MRHRTRPIVTVQGMGDVKRTFTDGGIECGFEKAMVRLRGKWVCALFPPGTRLVVTRELRGDKLVLVLEECDWSTPVLTTERTPRARLPQVGETRYKNPVKPLDVLANGDIICITKHNTIDSISEGNDV